MKKVIIALSALVVLAAAVVFVVNAQDPKTGKKSSTEVTTGSKCGGSATCDISMKNNPGSSCCKSATCQVKADSTKCKMRGGEMSRQMSCCKEKTETASVSGKDCTPSCKMKSGSETR